MHFNVYSLDTQNLAVMIFKLMEEDKGGNDLPVIKVIGVGGGGSNAVTHMYKQGIVGVEFAICNTDNQAMNLSPIPTKIKLGPHLTEGRGAGSKPSVGKMACEESIEAIKEYLSDDTKMLFVTAGMGGGTGTGAAPIIAQVAQEMDILTVGIVTLPFTFEGRRRTSQGMEGLEELKKNVDTLIVISNDKLRQIFGSMTLSQAFMQADNVLSTAAKGIAEIITVPGYVNVDFEDVNTVMRDSGVAIMGTAVAEGDSRAKKAIDEALNSPLLEDNNIRGAQNILLNITSGSKEVTMDEIFEITEWVQEEAGYGTNLIWGNCYEEGLGEKLSVTVIATGFERQKESRAASNEERKVRVSLDEDEAPRHTSQPRDTYQPRTNSLADIGFDDDAPQQAKPRKTIEFDDIPRRVDKNASNYSYNEPYMAEQDRIRREDDARRRQDEERLRRDRLRNVKPKLSNPDVVYELEREPAYKRRGVSLDDIQQSNEEPMSRWSVGDGENPELRKNGNSFLHDNVD